MKEFNDVELIAKGLHSLEMGVGMEFFIRATSFFLHDVSEYLILPLATLSDAIPREILTCFMFIRRKT